MIVGIVFFGIGVGHFVIDGPVAGESLAAQRIGLDLAGLFALADFDVCFGEVEVVEVAVNADTFFGEVAELELVADFVVRVFVDQCAQVELSVLGHAVVDIEDEADALARQVVPAHFIIIVRNESVQVVVEAPAASFVVMGLNAEALIVDGGRNAELVAKHVGIGQRGFRGDVFGQLRDFWTSIPSRRSDGTPSSKTPRRSSGDGVRTPLMVAEIRSELMPRIET